MPLQTVDKRVVISIDLESKNYHTFSTGLTIRRERQFNNLNRRETEPVNATVVSADNIPDGAEILIHPNSIHDSNKIFDYKPLSGEEVASTVKYYSISETECYAWRFGTDEFKPIDGFVFGLRVFKPYKGLIQGIEHEKIKEVLYITTGSLKGNVVHTLKACDYEIIFQEHNGQEARLIRCRHFENDDTNEREEIIAVDHSLTEKVLSGDLLVGLSVKDAKEITI